MISSTSMAKANLDVLFDRLVDEALEQKLRERLGLSVATAPVARRRGRRVMTPAEKKAVSARMKRLWAERKKAGKKAL